MSTVMLAPSQTAREAFSFTIFDPESQPNEPVQFETLFKCYTNALLAELRDESIHSRAPILRDHIRKQSFQFVVDSHFASRQIQGLMAVTGSEHEAVAWFETIRLGMIEQYSRYINTQLYRLLRVTLDLEFHDRFVVESQKPQHQAQNSVPQLMDFPEWSVYNAEAKANIDILVKLNNANINLVSSSATYCNTSNSVSNLRDIHREIENQLHATCTEQVLFVAHDIHTICSQARRIKPGACHPMFYNHVFKSCKSSQPELEMIERLEKRDVVVLHEIQQRIDNHSWAADLLLEAGKGASKIVQEHRGMVKKLMGYRGTIDNCIKNELQLVSIRKLQSDLTALRSALRHR